MRYRVLGRSGLKVSELCLGTMTFGEDWGWGAPRDECRRMFSAFAEAGGNFIDTANRYTNGTAESYLGDFLNSDRSRFVVATKYTLAAPGGANPNASGNHRKNMIESLESSLKRMHIEYVDLFYVHIWDAMTPIEETMRALDDLVRAGKVLYVGVSDMPAWMVSRGQTIAELRGWSPFISLQIEYSLNERTPERDLIPMARQLDIGITAWAPLAAGVLTGKYTRGGRDREGRIAMTGYKKLDQRAERVARTVDAVADELGCSSAQVALAWLLAKPAVIPIVGATKLTQLEDNLKAAEIEMDEDHLLKLNEASAIDLGFPHEFMNRDGIMGIRYGGFYDRIDYHRSKINVPDDPSR